MTDYEFYKRMGVCTQCKKNIIFKNEGRCPECKAYHAEWMINNRNRKRDAERQKERINERREQGVCFKCGGELTDGYKTCRRCRERIKIYRKRMKLKKME